MYKGIILANDYMIGFGIGAIEGHLLFFVHGIIN